MLEAKLVTALESVIPEKVFPDVAPLGTVAPWVTYQQVGGKALAYVEQTLPRERNGRYQVTVWAKTRTEAVMKALAIEQSLIGSPMQVELSGAQRATYDTDTGLYGSMQDYSIWDER